MDCVKTYRDEFSKHIRSICVVLLYDNALLCVKKYKYVLVDIIINVETFS